MARPCGRDFHARHTVMRAILKNPEATAEAFRGLVYTGDLAVLPPQRLCGKSATSEGHHHFGR